MEKAISVTKLEAIASVFLSLFFVIFAWGFWSRGIYALGANFALYLAAMVLFFAGKLSRTPKYSARDLAWITPFFLMALSYALYENPFFKIFNFLVFPVSFACFYAYSWLANKKEADWNFRFLTKIILRLLSFFVFLRDLIRLGSANVFKKSSSGSGLLKRTIAGLTILLVALLIIVPILSSADPLFAQKLKPIYDFVSGILSKSAVAKIIVLAVLSAATLTALLAWGRPHEEIVSSGQEKTRDLVAVSIVLGGIFLVYLLFLWVQIDRLWVGALPFDFSETENLVKSGFWQLLFLSFVNLAIFFFLYKKTAPAGQKMLGAFAVASLLLLVSSAQRMYLYVTYYGFSYEKFYASYAVLFCAILFVWLILRLFAPKRSNVFKFLAFQFIWMFALVSVFPVEQFILSSNMSLVKKEGSHIRLYEMSMLSADVLTEIKDYQARGLLAERPNLDAAPYDWNDWTAKREKEVNDKKWYELNLSSLRAR